MSYHSNPFVHGLRRVCLGFFRGTLGTGSTIKRASRFVLATCVKTVPVSGTGNYTGTVTRRAFWLAVARIIESGTRRALWLAVAKIMDNGTRRAFWLAVAKIMEEAIRRACGPQRRYSMAPQCPLWCRVVAKLSCEIQWKTWGTKSTATVHMAFGHWQVWRSNTSYEYT